MSETTVDPNAGTPGSEGQPNGAEGEQPKAAETDWKAEARKWERLAKTNQAAAESWTAAQEKAKSAEVKAQEERDALTGRVNTAESQAVRFEIALEKGLTKTQAMRLVGSNADELRADADQLIKDLGLEVVEDTPEERQAKRRANLTATQAGGNAAALNGDGLLAALKAAVGA